MIPYNGLLLSKFSTKLVITLYTTLGVYIIFSFYFYSPMTLALNIESKRKLKIYVGRI